MKIEPTAAFRYYQTVNTRPSASGETAEIKPSAPAHADKVAFSGDAAQRGELGRLSGRIASDLETGVSAARLGELREAVENGAYYVTSGQLADAILDRII